MGDDERQKDVIRANGVIRRQFRMDRFTFVSFACFHLSTYQKAFALQRPVAVLAPSSFFCVTCMRHACICFFCIAPTHWVANGRLYYCIFLLCLHLKQASEQTSRSQQCFEIRQNYDHSTPTPTTAESRVRTEAHKGVGLDTILTG